MLWDLNRATESRPIQVIGGAVARQKLILPLLVGKAGKGRLFGCDVLIHPNVALIATDRGREVRHVVVDD